MQTRQNGDWDQGMPVRFPWREDTKPVQTSWITPDKRLQGALRGKIIHYLCLQEKSPCLLTGQCECWCAFGRAYKEGKREIGQ